MIQRRMIPVRNILCSMGVACLYSASLAGARPIPEPCVAAEVSQVQSVKTFVPWVAISPVIVTLRRGQTVQFSAQMNEDPDGPIYIRQPIDYSFLEKERFGGGVDMLTGLFTAPDQAGVFHILVTREDFPECQAVAVVNVMP